MTDTAWTEHEGLHEAYTYGVETEGIDRIPSVEELSELWQQDYDPSGSLVDVPDVYGFIRETDGQPTALVSVDLCEVTRKTVATLLELGGLTLDHLGVDYEYGPPLGIEDNDIVVKILQALMNRDQIEPVDDIDQIANTLQVARQAGAYVVANTSTLPGCENATVKWLAKYMRDCFDGIVIPRNHFGEGSITKGTALTSVMDLLAKEGDVRISHVSVIDDAPHHVYAVRRALADIDLHSYRDYTPKYNWNVHDNALNLCDTPLDCFDSAKADLSSWLAIPQL